MTPLRERMIEDMRIPNLARNTQISCLLQVSLFARYFGKSPDTLGQEEIRAYQVYLTEEKKLSPRPSRLLYRLCVSFTKSHSAESGTWKKSSLLPSSHRNYPSFSALRRCLSS